MRSGRAGCEAHGVALLAMPDDLARDGGLAPTRAAQLTHDALLRASVDVDLLAGHRRASAIHAAMAVRLERPEAAAQQHDLELLYVGGRRSPVARCFRRRSSGSCR